MKKDSNNNKIFRLIDVQAGSIVGGPWAASYFFYKNFNATDNRKLAKFALAIGVVSPVIIILLSSVGVLAGAPQTVFTGLYVGTIFLLIRSYKDRLTVEGDEMPDRFYFSRSKAARMTLFFVIIYLLTFLGAPYAYQRYKDPNFTPADYLSSFMIGSKFNRNQYNVKIDEFNTIDEEALAAYAEVFQQPGVTLQQAAVAVENTLVKYSSLEQLVNEMSGMENLPSAQIKQVKRLKSYVQMRLQLLELISKGVKENSSAYVKQVEELVDKINTLVGSGL